MLLMCLAVFQNADTTCDPSKLKLEHVVYMCSSVSVFGISALPHIAI